MKIFALYLPQFHTIKENDEWWGKGFTEWSNVKKAKPLFKGHMQPKHPLEENYYNLLDRTTVEWQTALMKEYQVDGFIYYHYYFNGKLLLEKPAENLLKWRDVEQPFFFNWANHSWNRAWKGSKEVLISQEYGDEKEWRKHYEYLLPFFKDYRYEKINNKPLLMIYNIHFPEMKEMFLKFNEWCVEDGFDGIHIVEEIFSLDEDLDRNSLYSKSFYYTQPLVAEKLFLKQNVIRKYYRKIRNRLIQKGFIKSVDIYNADDIVRRYMKVLPQGSDIWNGIFFEWDNTPRHGNRGRIIRPLTKKCFMEYMDSVSTNDFLVVNAWNEWAEGMMLEPTSENGYKYLEWIREWKTR